MTPLEIQGGDKSPHSDEKLPRSIILFLFLVAILASPVGAEVKPADDAPQPSPPEKSATMFRVPAGFRIQLVASEPLLADPTCVAFDAQGRLFV